MKKLSIPKHTIIEKISEGSIPLGVDGAISSYEGFFIETNKGTICLGIDDYQHCCERSGFHIECKEEDLGYYIGAKILEIVWEVGLIPEKEKDITEFDTNQALPLLIKTSKGDIDLWVYNEHNGYYAHNYLVKVLTDFEEKWRI